MKTVSLSLPDALIDRLDEVAAAERRSRSNAAVVLIEQALAANRRPASDSRSVAGQLREHLRRHADLSGFPSPAPTPEDSNG
jgi:metal-responsive CopG/Arc/MetJ family transcriptional regulator